MDMTSAFDTIIREKLVEVLEGIIPSSDLRIVITLLENTKLKIGKEDCVCTEVGSPQGDSLSPVLFTVYLEAALKDVRLKMTTKPILELCYADDIDYIFESQSDAERNEKIIAQELEKWNLICNHSKTELTELRRDEPERELWRKTKKLGSLLGDEQDKVRRQSLASSAFSKLTSLWRRTGLISERKRIKIYNALIHPILTYNCGGWGLTERSWKNMDAFHRSQLRRIMGIVYPRTISNEKLYEITHTEPISKFAQRMRWNLAGHVLRMSNETPAKIAQRLYFHETAFKHPGFRGRPRSALPNTLSQDLQYVTNITHREHSYAKSKFPYRLCCAEDLENLQKLAQDRVQWKEITSMIVGHSPTVKH